MWVLGMEAGYSSRATSSLTISSPWHCLYNKTTPRKDFRYELPDEGSFANPRLESLFSLQNLHCEYRLSSILPADSLGWERNEAQTQYPNSPETERKPLQRKWSEYQDIENKGRRRFDAVNVTMYNIQGWSQRSKVKVPFIWHGHAPNLRSLLLATGTSLGRRTHKPASLQCHHWAEYVTFFQMAENAARHIVSLPGLPARQGGS